MSNKLIVHGIDLIEIERFGRANERWGDRFLIRIFTNSEIAYCKSKPSPLASLASHFVAKEAVVKALGMKISGWGYGTIGWREIEVLPDKEGKPQVYLHGRARKRSQEIGLKQIALSMSHTNNYALASTVGVISERNKEGVE